MKIKYAAAAIMFIFTALTATAQENPDLEDIRISLDSIAARNPAYSEPVDVSFTDFPVT